MAKFLTAIMVMAVSLSAWTQAATYGGGSGTPEDPYEIRTPEQMNTIGANPADWDKHFKLMADIDMSIYTGTQYNIIGTDNDHPFTGAFDGNEYTISNLTYANTESVVKYVGLFGYAEHAVIQNLHVENITISAYTSGYSYESGMGGITGEIFDGEIINCSVTGSIRRTAGVSSVGGIAGSNESGTLTDCHFDGIVQGIDGVGGLVGYNDDGTIINCYAAGSVYGEVEDAGGLAGYNSGTITNCYAACSVEGVTDTGGLVGTNWEGDIIQCYASGSVSATGSNTGGLVGRMMLKGPVDACYATGTVNGTDSVGGLIGYLGSDMISYSYATGQVNATGSLVGGLIGNNPDGYGIITMCFWDTQTSGQTTSAGGTGKTTAQMQTLATYMDAGWDFIFETWNGTADSWTISSGHYPYLAWQTGMMPPQTAIVPDVVSMTQANAESIVAAAGFAVWTNYVFSDTVAAGSVVNQQPSAGTVLLANMAVGIEVSIGSILNPGSGTQSDPYKIVSVADWQALMSNSNNWNKSFVLINDLDLRYVTLTPIGNSEIPFTGSLDGNGHIIHSVTMNMPNSDDVGLFGHVGSSGQISNLGLESANITGRGQVGGLVGYNEGTISNCYVNGTVYGTGGGIGGIAGSNDGLIVLSHTTGSVSGKSCVGGLAGGNRNTLIGCYSEAAVLGTDTYFSAIGGLIGESADSTIINCYAAGSVNGSFSVGGFIGVNNFFNTLINCYSTGLVNGTGSSSGGLIGWSDQTARSINCFWDVETSGKTTSAGGTGKTTIEMQTLDTFTNAGWDFIGETANGFHDDWQIQANDYPRLAFYIWDLAGSGTSLDPYIIGSAADLGKVRLRPSACYQLDGNLDLTGVSWSSAVVPVFKGVFDGQGFVISNLTIHQSDIFHVGLFGFVDSIGQIRNLGMESTDITGFEYVGGLVGRNNGTLIGCHATGSVSGTFGIGGLVGSNGGTLTSSYVTSWVSGIEVAGGLVGHNTGNLISCYATGSVSGTADYGSVGGLVGENLDGSLTNCYAAGLVSGMGYYVGGLVGLNSYGSLMTTCFWDTQASGQTGSAGRTTEEMKTLSTFIDAGWDFAGESANGLNDYWQMADGDYPRLAIHTWTLEGDGTDVNPYIVADAEDLGRVWLRPSACFRLSGNLDLNGISWSSAVVPAFAGDFDGQGHIIFNLTINQPDSDYTGLFGHAVSGQIHDLGLEKVNITGNAYTGGLVGYNDSILTDCYVTGSINGGSSVGGLTGYSGGTIIACHAASSVDGNLNVGGLTGSNGATITACYATGSVYGDSKVGGLTGSSGGIVIVFSATGLVDGNSSVGGLTGSNGAAITACYATGSVYGNSNVGGLAGFTGGSFSCFGQLSACYATGMVSGVDNVGGLVGQNNWAALTACYAAGSVSGSGLVGGLVGYASNLDLVVNSCFWDIQTCGQETSVGGTGKTTAQMQDINTFLNADWDLTTADDDPADWVMPSSYYPQLALFPLISIPNVVGLTQTNAQSAIESAGLSMGLITFVSSQTVPVGVVISQSLAQGMQVNPGMVVNLVVSLGFYDSGTGTIADPYQISTKFDLLLLTVSPDDYDKCFTLTADIDMEGQIFNTALIAPAPNYWEEDPDTPAFTGIFDGNNHKITNFIIEGSDNSGLGLFGQIGFGAQVKNVGLENCSVSGSSDSYTIGGLCGYNNGTIRNCYNTGNVTGSESVGGLCGYNFGLINASYTTGIINGSYYVGGICGYNDLEGVLSTCHAAGDINGYYWVGGLCGGNASGTINNCYAAGMVTGYDGIGGLCGVAYGDIVLGDGKIIERSIKNSYATGAVIGNDIASEYIGGLCGDNTATLMNCYATGTVSGNRYVGGLCGMNSAILRDCYAAGNIMGANDSHSLGGLCGMSNLLIQNCYALGAVSAGNDSYNLGGLCGNIEYCQIINCYATGAVTGGANSHTLGGLLGAIETGWIKNCYAAGTVAGGEGSYNLGGFCGENIEGQFNHCFWDIEASGQTTSAAATGKTTVEMMTCQTFIQAGWDFTNETDNGPVDIWRMCVDGVEYPKFAHQFSGTGDFTCPAGVGMEDLSSFIGCWLGDCGLKRDITFDDVVNMNDIQYVSLEWLLPEGQIVVPYYADVTGDMNVNLEDLMVVADQWLLVSCRRADLNHDDAVDLADLSILAANWMKQ